MTKSNNVHTVQTLEDVEKLIATHGKAAKFDKAMAEAVQAVRDVETANLWEAVNHAALVAYHTDADYQRLYQRAWQGYYAARRWNDVAIAFARQGWIHDPDTEVPEGMAMWAALIKPVVMP